MSDFMTLDELTKKIKKHTDKIKIPSPFTKPKKELIGCLDNDLEMKINFFGVDNIIKNNLEINCKELKQTDDNMIKSIKIELFPKNEQKIIIDRMMIGRQYMYNEVVVYLNKKLQKYINGEITYKQSIVSKKDLRNRFYNTKIILMRKYNVNSHTLDYAINDANVMYKSIKTNFRKKYIKNAIMKKTEKNNSMKIEKLGCGTKTIYSRKIEENIETIKINDNEYLKLNLNNDNTVKFKENTEKVNIMIRENNKYYIIFRKKIETEEIKNRHPIISIDLGLRTLATGITDNSIVEIGNGVFWKIFKYINKIEKIQKNYNLFHDIKYKKQLQNKKKALKKNRRKLKNKVTDYHWKTVDFLTKSYETIVIGDLHMDGILRNKKTPKIVKKVGSSLRMYELKEKLKYKCMIRQNNYKETNEWMTSKICSNCGNIHKNLGSKKIYVCEKCKKIYDRDVNAAKNILIKSM